MASLIELNNLRAQNNKAPLKAWKESKAKLEAAIEKEISLINFEAPVEEIKQQAPRAAIKTEKQLAEEVKAMHDTAAEKERIERVKASAKNKPLKIHADPRPTKEIMKTIGDTFTLADLARELNIDPKLARVKARRHLKQTNGAWVFTADQRDYVTQVLQSDHRKK